MTLSEALEGKKYEDILKLLDETKKETDAFKAEYTGSRASRETQVGKRPDKNTKEGPVTVNKIPVQFQRKIVNTASSFLFGSPVRLELKTTANDTETASTDEKDEETAAFLQQWEDLRLDSKLLKLAEAAKSGTEGALLFRAVADGKVAEEDQDQDTKLRVDLLDGSKGTLLPGFDDFGDMILFGYQIKVKVDDQELTRTYLYDELNVTILDDDSKALTIFDQKPHFFQRIPVVYVSQDEPDWFIVKELIDRYEMNLSKFCDTNDYFASPFFKAVGKVEEPPKKDDSGKIFMLDVITTDKGQILQSDLNVVSWDQATEATKLEFEEIKGLIYSLTDTPDLSFDSVKGLGNISGVALELMFLAPILKAKYSESIYKTAVERVINVLRAGMVYATQAISGGYFEKRFDVVFQSVLPTNLSELVSTLSEATMNKPIMSQQTALELNPLIKDPAIEKERIDQENAAGLGESLTL